MITIVVLVVIGGLVNAVAICLDFLYELYVSFLLFLWMFLSIIAEEGILPIRMSRIEQKFIFTSGKELHGMNELKNKVTHSV